MARKPVATSAAVEAKNTNPEFEARFEARLRLYGEQFNIEDLNDANDRSLLHIMIKTELMIDDLQAQIQTLIDDNPVENATNIKKLADLLRDATNTITTLQRTLGIDRKSRRNENVDSPADYIKTLKSAAKEFVDKRLIRVYCPNCKILVARIAPVHKHTAFTLSVQCNQCGKAVRVRRDDRDVLFDIRDSEWRKKHRAEVVQPRRVGSLDNELPSDEEATDTDNLVIFADLGNTVELQAPPKLPELGDDIVLGDEYGTTGTA
jgi:RNase P subunit RPR2